MKPRDKKKRGEKNINRASVTFEILPSHLTYEKLETQIGAGK